MRWYSDQKKKKAIRIQTMKTRETGKNRGGNYPLTPSHTINGQVYIHLESPVIGMPSGPIPKRSDVDLGSIGLASEAPPDGPHKRPIHLHQTVPVHFLCLVQHHSHLYTWGSNISIARHDLLLKFIKQDATFTSISLSNVLGLSSSFTRIQDLFRG